MRENAISDWALEMPYSEAAGAAAISFLILASTVLRIMRDEHRLIATEHCILLANPIPASQISMHDSGKFHTPKRIQQECASSITQLLPQRPIPRVCRTFVMPIHNITITYPQA
jgi:hypothetical protein